MSPTRGPLYRAVRIYAMRKFAFVIRFSTLRRMLAGDKERPFCGFELKLNLNGKRFSTFANINIAYGRIPLFYP